MHPRRTGHKFLCSQTGSLSVVAGITAVAFVSAAGLAVDYARFSNAAVALQSMLDGAALAGASPKNATDAARVQMVNAYLTNQSTSIAGLSNLTTSVTAVNNRVYVQGSGQLSTAFMRVVSLNKMQLNQVSVAERSGGELGCMIALNPTASGSLSLQGTADIIAKKCDVQVNSTSGTALTQGGSSTLNAQAICTVGGYSGSNLSPTPKNCKAMDDPLASTFAADFAKYSTSVCDQWNGGSGKPMTLSTTVNLKPGVYCGGIKATNNSNGVMAPGVYFIKDGELDVRSGGKMTGTGVTIVLIGNSSTDLNVQAGGSLVLKAPTSGDFAGIAIAHHPSSIPSSSKGDVIIGGGTITVDGIIYTPKQLLTITGNGDISMDAKQFALIADRLSIQGNGQLRIGPGADSSGSGLPELPSMGNPIVRLLPDATYLSN